jgi:serine/threonine protein phosphatase PrpC
MFLSLLSHLRQAPGRNAPLFFAGGALATAAATATAAACLGSSGGKESSNSSWSSPHRPVDRPTSMRTTSYANHLNLSSVASGFSPDIRGETMRQPRDTITSPVSITDPVPYVFAPTAALIFMSSLLKPAAAKLPKTPAVAPLILTLAATGAAIHASPTVISQAEAATQKKFCPTYGCPMTPSDMLYIPVQQALQKIRNKSKESLKTRVTTRKVLQELRSTGDEGKATLTMTGFKGGDANDQINQDRAFVISPFLSDGKDARMGSTDDLKARRLLGVFDGHATFGEKVSEYCMTELPKMLASKLSERLTEDLTESQQEQIVVATLHESFLELDQTTPHGESGGCTASVMLQLGKKLYFANTGDSPTFLCVHHASTKKTEVVYITQEDKPSLPTERARIEAMGGKVWVPRGGGSARVLFTDPVTGDQTGIAMSRSIGDHDVGKYGVIADPTIHVIDLEELIQEQNKKAKEASGGIMDMFSFGRKVEESVDDVHIFAVSASDGMMDILNPHGIARFLAPSLCQDTGEHLLTACEKLVSTAADGWQRASPDGRYRDDIAVSVCKIRTPPSANR